MMTNVDEPLTVSVAQTKALLGIGHTKVSELIRNQTLKSMKLGSRRLVLLSSIQEFVADCLASEQRD